MGGGPSKDGANLHFATLHYSLDYQITARARRANNLITVLPACIMDRMQGNEGE